MPRFTEPANAQIDRVHSQAICEEIGYRLRRFCAIEAAEHPRHRVLLDQLGRMEEDGARSSDGSAARRGNFASELFRTLTPLRRRRG